jgi:pimeloyl-ACP methyl ester carboxylesterase
VTVRGTRTVLKLAAVLLIAAAVVGTIYEQRGAQQDAQRLPPVGRLIDIGGRRLNIYCSGVGGPAVVLDTGNGEPGYAWSEIQPEIAKYTRACWFDRAGEGWSDPGPFPRTSAATAKDLHELLTRAGIAPPFVLVGHSLGGLDARVYNGLFPAEVAGMVLVDAAHEDEPKRAPAFMLGRTLPRSLWRPLHLVGQAAWRAGVIPLLTSRPSLPDDSAMLTREQILDALRRQPKAIATGMNATAPESYDQAHAAGGLGDRPLMVLTRGKVASSPNARPTEMDRQFAAYEQVWMHEIQPQLARLSSRGRQVIVTTSGHRIPDEAPGAVLEAVREIVNAVRRPDDRD